MAKEEGLGDILNNLSADAFGPDAQEGRKDGLCISCGQPAEERCYSSAGLREYHISGLCEECYDDIMGEG